MPDSTSLAEIKISELPVATSANATDQLEANQAGTTRSITVAQVGATVSATLPPPTWTSITGKPSTFPPTLPIAESDVTNLVSDLAAKAPLASPVFTGDPKAPTPTAGDNDTSIATTSFVQSTVSTAVAGVTPTLPAGAVGYGSAGNVLTGVLANMAFDATNKRLGINKAAPAAALDVVGQTNTAAITMSGYSLTGSNATGCFSIAAALNTTGQPDIFAINVTDTSNAGGNAFVIRGGPSGTASLIRTTMSGDTRVAGWCQARLNDALVTNGADYFAYYLGNGSGGNIGLFAGLSNPTFSTFGRYGSIYLNGASPGLPYYNNNGTTGWDRLVGETSTQTLTNKTFAPASISPGSNGQVLTTVSGAAAWAAGGGSGTVTSTSVVSANGLAGTVATATTTPAITLSTTITGLLKGNGTAISAATAGTDYIAPTTSGTQIQMAFTETGAVATGTTIIPFDDTIPQITEGNEYMTCTITPKSATSRLIIQVVWNGTSSAAAGNGLIAALFQDATANALAAGAIILPSPGYISQLSFNHSMLSGTTSATTFRVRAGCNAAGTTTFNGSAGARLFGGVMASSIVIQEVA